jgi:hypothetical protein
VSSTEFRAHKQKPCEKAELLVKKMRDKNVACETAQKNKAPSRATFAFKLAVEICEKFREQLLFSQNQELFAKFLKELFLQAFCS